LILNGVQSDAKWKNHKHYGCAMLASASIQMIERGAQSNSGLGVNKYYLDTMVAISNIINNMVLILINQWFDISLSK
jgi:hypothetical protein